MHPFKDIFQAQEAVLKVLAAQASASSYYLAGGTALAKFYFKHRESYDLDFFTQHYSSEEVARLVAQLKSAFNCPIQKIQEQKSPKFAQIEVYEIPAGRERLKIDFVEDVLPLIEPLNHFNGMAVLTLSDIYLRKIFAVTGAYSVRDKTGRSKSVGGRQEARDFFDLYFLSATYCPLSDFVSKYCDPVQTEGLHVWFHSFKRLEMKTGLMELKTEHHKEFSEMERHFKNELDRLIGGMLP